MTIFLNLFSNLIPLYIMIGLGYLAGRYLNVERESVANLLIYLCLPIVVFGFVVNLELHPSYIALPLLITATCMIVGGVTLYLGKSVFADNRANLLSMCTSMPNAGYFGLPLVLLLFETHLVAVYMFMMLGVTLYDSTIGYYIAARGNFSIQDSLSKLVKFPALYAIAIALACNLGGIEMPQIFETYWGHFKGAYVVMGMMIIGVALAKIDKFALGPRFLSFVCLGKFVLWPAVMGLFIWSDVSIFGLLNTDIHKLMFVISVMPPAANIAAFAAQLNVQPEKAATTVLMCTVFALFYIPFMIAIFQL